MNQVINMIIDITNPVAKPIFKPSFEGNSLDIVFRSTSRYQSVGTRKIHILQEMKNICEISSSSIILIPNITDMEGTKPTSSKLRRDLFFYSISNPEHTM